MPKLWEETIETHREAVREATLKTTAALVAKHGLRGVTMARIAEETGIGRATLYKYFPDVETILLEWHERLVNTHLDRLIEIRDDAAVEEKLAAVLDGYALSQRRHGGSEELSEALHAGVHMVDARHRLRRFMTELLSEAADRGEVRGDVSSGELAVYCIHALEGAARMRSNTAARRLAAVTLAGLRPEP